MNKMAELLAEVRGLTTTKEMINWFDTKGPPKFTAASGPTDPKIRSAGPRVGGPPPPPRAGGPRSNARGRGAGPRPPRAAG